MKKLQIAGWELTTNEKGVEMATLPADLLRHTLAYVDELEQKLLQHGVMQAEGSASGTGAAVGQRSAGTVAEGLDDSQKIFIDGDFNDSYESRVRRSKPRGASGKGQP